MPTGYTDAIKDGIDFRTYAMNCARAFGACIELRDESGGGDKIPEAFKPSDYNAKALVKDRKAYAAVEAMSAEDCERAAVAEWTQNEADRERRRREKTELRLKYEAMLAQVNAWQEPTPEHIGLKQFMRDQITQSIDFDCGPTLYPEQTSKLSGVAWRAKELNRITRDIEYHERHNAKEIERTNERNGWIAALRDSLKETA